VVINAHCDLMNGKLDGVIAYLPMYPFKEYVAEFWAVGYIAEVLAPTTGKIIDIVGDDGAAAESLHAWIVTDGPAVVNEALTASTKLKKGQATSICQEI
jgi:hypothetical protein